MLKERVEDESIKTLFQVYASSAHYAVQLLCCCCCQAGTELPSNLNFETQYLGLTETSKNVNQASPEKMLFDENKLQAKTPF